MSLKSADGEWLILPADGRSGEPPAWPLADPTERELELWRAEWRRPQATVWERQGQALEVALFVRALKDAEHAEASTASRTLVRQLMEALGISVPGLLRNRWKIGEPQAPPVAAGQAAPRSSARDRLTVVTGGGA